MLFTIPILVEERLERETPLKSFVVRPLFHAKPVQRGDKLSRVLQKLTGDLQDQLVDLGREPRHDALAVWCFNPPLEETSLDLRLEMASGSHKARWFFAGYPTLGRTLYFTPVVADLHFEVLPGQSLVDRATEVLTRHFREREKKAEIDLAMLVGNGRMRLSTVEISLHPAMLAKAPAKPTRALIFGGMEKKDGEQELRKTGRTLQSFYPDDLDRAVNREREIEDLARIFAGADRRPVVLVGPRKVGKTALVHELVWRIVSRKPERYGGGREVWLVSPMRLISGMIYLGEWENRVLAILDHMQTEDQVLYFDDLIGLFTAGLTAASDLSVAQVLKPALEKRRVRVLAEITPEAWRVLRERDRGFADLFHVIPVAETPEAETIQVLVSVARQLEERHRCEFALNVVPKVFDLQRRFGGEAAFPGKAAGFLKRLAVRFAGNEITETQAAAEFQEQTGLHPAFLGSYFEPRRRTGTGRSLARQCIRDDLERSVAGQDHALEAFADVLVKFHARLQDPRRPLGVFLLLGPTGVGKTQAAKALATYLFSHEDRLLRFDMNEYVDAAAAPRLMGTPRDPEGLLTSAIRRQPFSVVLFDEIEKAAPEVFDLLLAVLDEGRLTDALGRVADFTHAIIVLTSNLGAREARSQLGFHTGLTPEQDGVYVGTAEKFFRPEFFNRLDRVIPFHPLTPEHLEGIAHRLIERVCDREGIRRRECLLEVTPEAVTQLVALGHHPQLGARALKRAVEREIAQPLGAQLAVRPVGPPMIATVDARARQLNLHLVELNPVPRCIYWSDQITAIRSDAEERDWINAVLNGTLRFLNRVDATLEAVAPSGRIEVGNLQPEQTRHFSLREQWKRVRELAEMVKQSSELPRHATGLPRLPNPRPSKINVRRFSKKDPQFDRQLEASTLRMEQRELASAEPIEAANSPLGTLFREMAFLEASMATPADDRPCALVFSGYGYSRFRDKSHSASLVEIWKSYHKALAALLGASITPFEDPLALWCMGLNLRRILPIRTTVVLSRCEHRSGRLTGFTTIECLEARSMEDAARQWRDRESAHGSAATFPIMPVIQQMACTGNVTDYRSGVTLSSETLTREPQTLLLSALPLPAELNF